MAKKKADKLDWVDAKAAQLPIDKNRLRSKDVAHILDCSPDDVIELARKGKLKASKHGRFWRFNVKDVKEYQKQKEKEEDEYFERIDRERYAY